MVIVTYMAHERLSSEVKLVIEALQIEIILKPMADGGR